jgi:hypothetical protein
LLVALLAAAGCAPVSREAEELRQRAVEAAAAAGRATATVSVPSLRVRAEATEFSLQIGSITEGQSFIVTGRSDNGEWFRLATPALPPGEGWVSTNFVIVIGDITDVPVLVAPTPLPPTVTPTRFLPTPTPRAAAATAAPTAAATQVAPTETPTETPTEAPTEVATATPTEAATEAAPAISTATATLLPTATPTETPAEFATVTATESPAETPVTPAAVLTATLPTATFTPAAPPAAGFARVVTDGTRLRVRAAPAAEAEIVGYVYSGEVYAVLESSADGEWKRIAGSTDGTGDNPNGGWVATRFLQLGQ